MPGLAARALAAIAALLAAAPAAALSDAPLGATTPGPLRALFLDMPLADARGAARPAVELRWIAANSWSTPTTVIRGAEVVHVRLDAQVDALQLALALPWGRLGGSALAGRLTTTVEARLQEVWGGWSDGGIETWHRLVGSVNFDRQRWPRDAVAIRLAQEGGPRLVDLRSARLGVGDVALRTALRLAGAGPGEPEGRFALALRLDLKLPTGTLARLGGSGGPDAGLGLAATRAFSPWLTGHALTSLRVVSRLPQGLALQPRRLQGGIDVSLVARLGPVALVLEDRFSTPLMESGWRLPATEDAPASTAYYALFRNHNQITGGVRWRSLTAYLSEDFTPGGGRVRPDTGARWFYDSNAPDVVIGVAWGRGL